MARIRTLLRLMPWVLGSALLAVLGLAAVREVAPFGTLRSSNDVLGSYLQTLGSIYAVLLAFVAYTVWQQFNESRTQVEREASEIRELFRITRALAEPKRARLQMHLHQYVCGVLDLEWVVMAERNGTHDVASVAAVLDAIWDELIGLEPNSECEKIVVAEGMSCFNQLCNARTARLSTSQLRMPRPLRLLLYIGAVILVCSTWLFAVDSFALHAFVTGASTAAVSHVLYVIEDLDDCFAGDWQVPRAAFLRVREMRAEGHASSDRQM